MSIHKEFLDGGPFCAHVQQLFVKAENEAIVQKNAQVRQQSDQAAREKATAIGQKATHELEMKLSAASAKLINLDMVRGVPSLSIRALQHLPG